MTFFEKYYPLIIMGSILGAMALIFALTYALIKNKKESMGFDRNIPDKEIVRRLLAYAKPYWKGFAFVLLLMAFSISYDILSPLLVGKIQGMIKADFELRKLYLTIALYASIPYQRIRCTATIAARN